MTNYICSTCNENKDENDLFSCLNEHIHEKHESLCDSYNQGDFHCSDHMDNYMQFCNKCSDKMSDKEKFMAVLKYESRHSTDGVRVASEVTSETKLFENISLLRLNRMTINYADVVKAEYSESSNLTTFTLGSMSGGRFITRVESFTISGNDDCYSFEEGNMTLLEALERSFLYIEEN